MHIKTPEQRYIILLVDDDPELLNVTSRLLEKEHFIVQKATTGTECLASIEKDKPDIILLDVMLPDFNGMDICRQIRSNPEYSSIHILMLSGMKTNSDDVAEGLNAGADNYLVKPVNNKEILAQIRAICRNIQTENALRDNERKFRNLFEHSNISKSITSPDGKLSVNQAWVKLFGYSREELANMTYEEITHPDDIAHDKSVVKDILDGRYNSHRWEKRYIHKNGELIWADISTILERDTNNNPLYFITSIIDITGRKQMEEQLALSELNFRSVFNFLAEGVALHEMVYNQSGVAINYRIINANPAYQQHTGIPPESATGKLATEVYGVTEPPYLDIYGAVAETGEPHAFEVFFEPHGRHYNISISSPQKGQFVTIFQNITDRKINEEALHDSERMLRESQEVAKMGSYSWVLSTGFWSSSKIMDEIFGIDENYIRSLKGWAALIHPDWREIMNEYVQKEVLENRKKFDKEYKINRHNSGEEIWVHGLGILETDSDNNPIRLIGTITDIDTRKRAEEALLHSEERFRLLFDRAPLGYQSLNKDGHFIDVNQAWLDTLGYERSEVIGKWFGDFLAPVYQEAFRKRFPVFKSLGQIHSEFEMVHKSGSIIFIAFDGKIGTDSKGHFKQTHCILKDITKEKAAEKTIMRLTRGIEQSPAAVIITDILGHIEYVNPKFEEMTAYPATIVMGKMARILNRSKNPGGFTEQLWNTISSGKEWKGDYLSRRMSGETYWESVLVSPIFDNDGTILNYIIIVEDITDQRRMIAELVTAKEKAEQSDRLKSTFLANMSHEIRTPMNAITGFAGMLSDKDISEDDRNRFSEIIQSRSDDLMHLINDILDVSRIESGNATVVKESISLNNILTEVEAVANQMLKRSKKEEISLVVVKGLPDNLSTIISDGFVIRQVYANLIENAIKFTVSGTIRVGYNPPENGFITCFVTDTGIGISKENQEVIFEHFRQAEIPDPHKYGGTGLGLSICRGSLALMGGEIHVESEPGQGSTFLFTLPYEIPVTDIYTPSTQDKERLFPATRSHDSVTRTGHPGLTGKRILLVEDEQTNMEYLQIILGKTGAEIITAFSGSELRNLFHDLDSFDLVLLDVRLPDANGWDLAVELKKLRPSLPVIAQTAYAMSSDRQKAEEAGCDGYISKPIKKEQLLNLISEKLQN